MPVVSVRARLLAVIAATAIVGLLGVGAAVYVTERQRIIASTDTLLRNNLESANVLVESFVAEDPRATAQDALQVVVQRVSPDDNMGVLGVVDGTATLVPGVQLDIALESHSGFVEHVVNEADGDNARIGRYVTDETAWAYVATPILVSELQSEDVLFVMAYDLNAELGEINAAARAYLIAAGVMIVLVVAIGSAAAGRLLRPLRHMRETAERVSGQDLDERIPVEGHDDVSELARTMNDMLDRIDTSLGAQRQLVSDVRHELRTPITIVRGHLELMDPSDPDEVRSTQSLTMDELDRMNALVQNLSEAAALDGATTLHTVPTDMSDLVDQIIRKANAIDGATVSLDSVVEVVADVDPSRITQAMLQLVQNAVTHGGGHIEIGSRVAGQNLELWVRDHGTGVAAEDRSKIFARFHSAASGGGSGLGLSIVETIAHAHGGSAIVTDPPHGPGAMFVVTVPLPPDAAAVATLLTQTGSVRIPPRPPLPTAGAPIRSTEGEQ